MHKYQIKIPSGAYPEPQEENLAKILVTYGIDLRFVSGSEQNHIQTIMRHFYHARSLRHLKIVTKTEEVLDFKK